jgi:hypothetical protein
VRFRFFHHGNIEVMVHRNILKLRKERRSAQERGEGSATGTSAAHEQSGDRSGRHLHATGPKADALQSDRKAHAEQGDWREVCLPPILYPFH